jgi:uncharacterized UPF0160 family protein
LPNIYLKNLENFERGFKMSCNQNMQIRRPNELFNYPQKKNLELLLDVLGFNFYVKNPDKDEFRISWVELREEYGIAISNKPSIKKKLQELADNNFISHLKMWNYGFSYRFENTIVDLEGFRKPRQWTFLDYTVMKQLNSVAYKVYTLAYKFYDFTKQNGGYGNETKYLEIPDFLKLFNYSTNGRTSLKNLSNKLLGEVRKAIKLLNEKFGLEITIALKKFGKPIEAIKLKFCKVPKLQRLARFFKKVAKETKKEIEQVVNKTKEAIQSIQQNSTSQETKPQNSKQSLIPEEVNKEYKNEMDYKVKSKKRDLVFSFMNTLIWTLFQNEFDDERINRFKDWVEQKYTRSFDASYDGVMAIFGSLRKNGNLKYLYEKGVISEDNGLKQFNYLGKEVMAITVEYEEIKKTVGITLFELDEKSSIIDKVKGAFKRE